jgi:hypothetical protein
MHFTFDTLLLATIAVIMSVTSTRPLPAPAQSPGNTIEPGRLHPLLQGSGLSIAGPDDVHRRSSDHEGCPKEWLSVAGKCFPKVTHLSDLRPTSYVSTQSVASPDGNIHHCGPGLRAESGPCIPKPTNPIHPKPGFRGPRDLDPLYKPERNLHRTLSICDEDFTFSPFSLNSDGPVTESKTLSKCIEPFKVDGPVCIYYAYGVHVLELTSHNTRDVSQCHTNA